MRPGATLAARWDEEKTTAASGLKGHIRTDAAYVRSDKVRYVDNEALRTGAAVSRDIYDHFAKQ
jgi:hypothetical protein